MSTESSDPFANLDAGEERPQGMLPQVRQGLVATLASAAWHGFLLVLGSLIIVSDGELAPDAAIDTRAVATADLDIYDVQPLPARRRQWTRVGFESFAADALPTGLEADAATAPADPKLVPEDSDAIKDGKSATRAELLYGIRLEPTRVGAVDSRIRPGLQCNFNAGPTIPGLKVVAVSPGSLAASWGFRAGDVLLSLGDQATIRPDDFIKKMKSGVAYEVIRQEKLMSGYINVSTFNLQERAGRSIDFK